MKQVPLFEAKNKLSTFVHLAEQGERIEITRHGKTAAVLVGAEALPPKDDSLQSPFFIAYTDFRKKLDCENPSEEEWKTTFEIERRKSLPRHPEDFD